MAKPLRRGAFLSGSDGQRTWVSFKYERLPLFCHCCGLLGHDIKHCAKFFALRKNSSEVNCQYGDWLESNGVRNRSPPRKASANPGQQSGEPDSERVDSVGRKGKDVNGDHREKESTSSTKSCNSFPGIVPNSVEVGSETEGTDMESMGVFECFKYNCNGFKAS